MNATDAQLGRKVMTDELETVNQYEAMADNAADPGVAEVIRNIADEEKVHAGEAAAIVGQSDDRAEPAMREGLEEAQEMLGVRPLHEEMMIIAKSSFSDMISDAFQKKNKGWTPDRQVGGGKDESLLGTLSTEAAKEKSQYPESRDSKVYPIKHSRFGEVLTTLGTQLTRGRGNFGSSDGRISGSGKIANTLRNQMGKLDRGEFEHTDTHNAMGQEYLLDPRSQQLEAMQPTAVWRTKNRDLMEAFHHWSMETPEGRAESQGAPKRYGKEGSPAFRRWYETEWPAVRSSPEYREYQRESLERMKGVKESLKAYVNELYAPETYRKLFKAMAEDMGVSPVKAKADPELAARINLEIADNLRWNVMKMYPDNADAVDQIFDPIEIRFTQDYDNAKRDRSATAGLPDTIRSIVTDEYLAEHPEAAEEAENVGAGSGRVKAEFMPEIERLVEAKMNDKDFVNSVLAADKERADAAAEEQAHVSDAVRQRLETKDYEADRDAKREQDVKQAEYMQEREKEKAKAEEVKELKSKVGAGAEAEADAASKITQAANENLTPETRVLQQDIGRILSKFNPDDPKSWRSIRPEEIDLINKTVADINEKFGGKLPDEIRYLEGYTADNPIFPKDLKDIEGKSRKLKARLNVINRALELSPSDDTEKLTSLKETQQKAREEKEGASKELEEKHPTSKDYTGEGYSSSKKDAPAQYKRKTQDITSTADKKREEREKERENTNPLKGHTEGVRSAREKQEGDKDGKHYYDSKSSQDKSGDKREKAKEKAREDARYAEAAKESKVNPTKGFTAPEDNSYTEEKTTEDIKTKDAEGNPVQLETTSMQELSAALRSGKDMDVTKKSASFADMFSDSIMKKDSEKGHPPMSNDQLMKDPYRHVWMTENEPIYDGEMKVQHGNKQGDKVTKVPDSKIDGKIQKTAGATGVGTEGVDNAVMGDEVAEGVTKSLPSFSDLMFEKAGFDWDTGNSIGQRHRADASARRKEAMDYSGEVDGYQADAIDASLSLADRAERSYGDNAYLERPGNTGGAPTVYDYVDSNHDPNAAPILDSQQNAIAENVSNAKGPINDDGSPRELKTSNIVMNVAPENGKYPPEVYQKFIENNKKYGISIPQDQMDGWLDDIWDMAQYKANGSTTGAAKNPDAAAGANLLFNAAYRKSAEEASKTKFSDLMDERSQ